MTRPTELALTLAVLCAVLGLVSSWVVCYLYIERGCRFFSSTLIILFPSGLVVNMIEHIIGAEISFYKILFWLGVYSVMFVIGIESEVWDRLREERRLRRRR
ncbi:hypothetical protein [Ktedonospora formicarum]|uniref:Uncharacterized protein n=1 Tax=Ktedonospora formicarum TaxID=2778364 RepID=A0A8J3ICF1_9CHLR|nr:hypothetical protein [Ktedonospora formicarum]GHO49549.1 hypothetical protein KSX_77120 [Ktedonospora formicarum]